MARFGSGGDLARELGVTRQAVHKAEKSGRITRSAQGQYDLDAAAIQYRLHTDPEQQRRALAQNLRPPAPPLGPPGPDGPHGQDWRGRRERAEAQLAELALAEREGTLVKAADVQRIVSRFLAGLRTQFESIPDRIAAEFGVDDVHRRRIRDRVRQELDQIRTNLVIAGRSKDQ
jgi:pyruvate/2-oxoglutarate dehydrogenase complex dihydrolipoamide acyltransferase (E2) component